MTFLKICILAVLIPIITGLVNRLDFKPFLLSFVKDKQYTDIFDHPYMVTARIERPIEEVELEEVKQTRFEWNVQNEKRLGEVIPYTEIIIIND